MDIDGFGPALASALINANLIRSQAYIYDLKAEEVRQIDRMGEKSAANLIAAIEGSKKNGLSRLVYALGIRNIGPMAAVLLAQHFGDMDALMAASADEICHH
jgi:DNA ligase (NAD+)